MNTGKVIIAVIVIAVVGLLAGLGVKAVSKGKTASSNSSKSANIAVPGTDKGFAWGVTLLTFPFPTYQEAFTPVQIAEADKLGINYIRVDYTKNNPKAIDVAVDAAVKQGLKVVLVIPFGPNDIYSDKNLEANTRTYVTGIVNRYKGKVAVYQLATEVSSVALGNNASKHGIELADYPPAKLTAVTTWVKTASEAVKKADPSAKRLVNDQWVHTGFFDNYFAKGGDFDILGWNWFSDMGTTMNNVTIDASKNQDYALMDKLKGYGKPIWLTEVSRRLGSQGNNEKAQSEFLTTMNKYIATEPAIKGFFVYNFLEDQAAPTQERGYSIVTANDSGKEQKITGHKIVFDTYKKIIEQSH